MDRDALLNENDGLQHELGLYTSVAVPVQNKPGSSVIRVGRAPLANQSMNTTLLHSKGASTMSRSNTRKLEPTPEMEYGEGDMTIDELSQVLE